jgi:hypothetical protein
MSRNPDETDVAAAEFAERDRRNQQQLGADLKPQYDFMFADRARRDRWRRVGWPKTRM